MDDLNSVPRANPWRTIASWLGAYKHAGLLVLGAAVVLFAASDCFAAFLPNFNLRRLLTRLARWRHWEFWPAWIFYPPVAIYAIWLAVKYRGLDRADCRQSGNFFRRNRGRIEDRDAQRTFSDESRFHGACGNAFRRNCCLAIAFVDEIRARLDSIFRLSSNRTSASVARASN